MNSRRIEVCTQRSQRKPTHAEGLCSRCYQRARRADPKQREKARAASRACRERNLEKCRALVKAWQRSNPGKARAASKAWREKNRAYKKE